MALRLASPLAESGSHIFSLPTNGSTAITRGSLLYVDETNRIVVPADSSAETTVTTLFVARETIASTATEIECYLVDGSQLWEADCAANTASTHALVVHDMSTALLVDNTATTDASTNGIFLGLKVVGAAADRKLIGKFLALGQVTA